MTTIATITTTPAPYIIVRSPTGGYDHIGARGVPKVVKVEQHFISINEHDATNILFWQTPRLLAGGRIVLAAADEDFAPQDHARGMGLLGDVMVDIEAKMRRGNQPIAPVQGPYTISPVRKDGDILLAAPTAPFFARVIGKHVEPGIQIANAVMFSKAPDLLEAGRLLVEGSRDTMDLTTRFEEGLNKMRSIIKVIDAAIGAI
jgi:hypothetical protein